MDQQDLIDRVETWARGSAEEDPVPEGATVAAATSVTISTPDGEAAIDVRALDNERLLLEHAFKIRATDVDSEPSHKGAMPSFNESVKRIVESRAGLLACRTSSKRGTYHVVLTHPLYSDGISKQGFMAAVTEMIKTKQSIERLKDEIRRQRELSADIAAPNEEPTARLEQPPGNDPAWAPTHLTPDGGMYTWVIPDPSVDPASTLPAGLDLRVTEWLGSWAKVDVANGWSGWVDGRILMKRGG
jgi:hypothetical protein